MTDILLREELHKQIDNLPDDIVREIADFALFLVIKRQKPQEIADWNDEQWREFSLGQFFREEDDIEYTLDEAQEIYKP